MKYEKYNELDSYNRLGEIFYILHKNNRKFLNDSLKEYDLNLLQAMALLMINEKNNISQQDLTENFYLSKSAVTKAISKLEKNGYITRTTSKEDKRQYMLNLTQKGENIIPVLNKINKTWEDTLGLDELSDDFKQTLFELAHKAIILNSKK